MKVPAYAALDKSSPLVPHSIDRREVGNSDVLIKIAYCGVCHSDIHQARDEWGGSTFPMVPGHEIVGHVEKVGTNVTDLKTGDIVGVGCMVDSCRSCSSCDEGLENYCETGFVGTYNGTELKSKEPTQGGYSTHIVTDRRFVLTVPKNLDLAATAPLLCAGITTYSPLKHIGAGPGDRVAVIGLGGLGHMGVKIANAMGCEVVVLSRSPNKKEDALKLGASEFVLSTDPEAMSRLKESCDFILDTVSAKHDISTNADILKRDGTMVLVGVPEVPLDLQVFPFIFRRRKLMGSLIGGIKQTQEMLDFCGENNITSDIEMIKANQINEAYERTVKGDVKYRFVIDIASMNN